MKESTKLGNGQRAMGPQARGQLQFDRGSEAISTLSGSIEPFAGHLTLGNCTAWLASGRERRP